MLINTIIRRLHNLWHIIKILTRTHLYRMNIQMVDLLSQYQHIENEINAGIQEVINTSSFINGPKVNEFAKSLETYLNVRHVIPCGNGTDALQIALMAIGLKPGDEVIVPAFTYVANAEVIGLLGLTPVMVDVDYLSFNVTLSNLRKALSFKTKAIIPVHLFGQSCDMKPIMDFANEHSLYVIEDNAQAIGARYKFPDGISMHTGTIGHIGCTSFFPSKNLGCYGDGGAIMTNDDELAERLQMIANHGQKKKYHHDIIGCNSRLDSIQASILNTKLKHLDEYNKARYEAAQYYSINLNDIEGIIIPAEMSFSTHVYHQYTLKVKKGKRDELKKILADAGIPSMIYYPLPLNEQIAFSNISRIAESLSVSTELCSSVLSLPIHTELSREEQDYIIETIKTFFIN